MQIFLHVIDYGVHKGTFCQPTGVPGGFDGCDCGGVVIAEDGKEKFCQISLEQLRCPDGRIGKIQRGEVGVVFADTAGGFICLRKEQRQYLSGTFVQGKDLFVEKRHNGTGTGETDYHNVAGIPFVANMTMGFSRLVENNLPG